MSAEPKTINQFPACTAPKGSDLLLGLGSANVHMYRYAISSLWANTSANLIISNAYFLVLKHNTTPANSSDVGTRPLHSMWCDDNFVYYVSSANTVKRGTLSSF
jgi:hypothetical protein